MSSPNWIDDVLKECEHVETPRSWLYWSLIAAISAAAGNNYYLKALKGAVLYKPNVYIILLGEPGLGKGFPIKLAKRIVSSADVTRVIAGRSSIQAIIKEIATSVTREKKGPISDSRAFLVNGELSTAIIQDPAALTTLTDLYDGEDNKEWANLLKGDGREQLKDPYITALFGSSEAHFYDTVPQVNIEGGFLRRVLIIYEEKRYKDTDLLESESDTETLNFPIDKFKDHLEAIASNAGRIIPSGLAREEFNRWRREWRANQKPDKTGFNNSVPDHILKVAMCLCLADYEGHRTLVITKDHMEEAIENVIALSYSNKRSTEGKGEDPLSKQSKMVLDFLIKAPNHEMRRKQLLTKGYGNYDASMLDKVLETLLEISWVTRERYVAGANSDWIIKLSGEPLEQYKKYLEDRKDRMK